MQRKSFQKLLSLFKEFHFINLMLSNIHLHFKNNFSSTKRIVSRKTDVDLLIQTTVWLGGGGEGANFYILLTWKIWNWHIQCIFILKKNVICAIWAWVSTQYSNTLKYKVGLVLNPNPRSFEESEISLLLVVVEICS
jgi:hypothetical protein